ncbi:hypothetical protein [Hymenobacter psychrotolerans]|uniref:hypothetical protein n=1 Tax=Hymenobacter psychrotolerans TaxID=344998 RepID=UPI000933F5F9|nr:hypothetical protein [Hymenobacter psychrotolerans]
MAIAQVIAKAQELTQNKVSQVELEQLISKIISGLLRKFGQKTVFNGANSEADSEVNNILTHVIEVGSIKVMKDKGLISNNDDELLMASLGTAWLMNVALGNVLNNNDLLRVYTGNGYYQQAAVQTLANRISVLGHTHRNYSKLSFLKKLSTSTVDELFNSHLGSYIK